MGFSNEIFKHNVAGTDLKKAVLAMMNIIKKKQKIPSVLQICDITCIFKKKESRNEFENYRGISIEPVISKLFQSIVKDHLVTHVERLVSPDQHGFLPGRSTTTNLTCYQDFISSQLNQKNQVHAVYSDF